MQLRGSHRKLMLTGSEKGGLIFGVVAGVIIITGVIIGATSPSHTFALGNP